MEQKSRLFWQPSRNRILLFCRKFFAAKKIKAPRKRRPEFRLPGQAGMSGFAYVRHTFGRYLADIQRRTGICPADIKRLSGQLSGAGTGKEAPEKRGMEYGNLWK